MKRNRGIMWLLAFLLIFFLSQDYVFIQWSGEPALFGFPIWLVWFAFVHLLFIAVFYWFSQKFWKE